MRDIWFSILVFDFGFQNLVLVMGSLSPAVSLRAQINQLAHAISVQLRFHSHTQASCIVAFCARCVLVICCEGAKVDMTNEVMAGGVRKPTNWNRRPTGRDWRSCQPQYKLDGFSIDLKSGLNQSATSSQKTISLFIS